MDSPPRWVAELSACCAQYSELVSAQGWSLGGVLSTALG